MTGALFYQAYRDTLQTQWSWLLQITKCIDVHLKENAAYNQVTGSTGPSCRLFFCVGGRPAALTSSWSPR